MTVPAALQNLSARLGADPLLVQAAGGNTSLKQDGVMWIKASGTWLKEALNKDIFVPVDLIALRSALSGQSPDCETCEAFVRTDLNASGLRPSIETTVHALMAQKVVLHVHCVNTIAHAIRADAEEVLAEKLKGETWKFIPYAKPGLDLAAAIKARLAPETDVLVFGNHGLVVAALDVDSAEKRLREIVALLQLPVRPAIIPDRRALDQAFAGSPYRAADSDETHALATDAQLLAWGRDAVYYPDHVIFLGVGVSTDVNGQPPLLAVPGLGVMIHHNAKAAVEPMGRCLADVLRRVPEGAILKQLSAPEIHALTHWEAEIYRQKNN